MKHTILTFLFLFISGLAFTQVYTIDAVNGLTISECGGKFFDSGGFVENC